MQFVGKLAILMSKNITTDKYVDPGVPIFTVLIKNIPIPNTLIDLGVVINVMTMETMQNLNICNLRPTPTILEMADRSRVKPKCVVDYVIVSLDSWEYPTEFVVLQPKI